MQTQLVLTTDGGNVENLMPTLKACRKMITDPEILQMVPDCQDIKSYFEEEMYDMLYDF